VEINFCRRCGTHLTPKEGRGGAHICQNGHIMYYKSYPAAIGLIVNQNDEVLVAIRGQEPGKGTLDLPGGFLDVREVFEAAAARELEEETGLKPEDYTPLEYLCDAVDDYEYQGEVLPVLVVVYWARLVGDATIKAADDVAELYWMPVRDINPQKVHPGFRGVRAALASIAQRLEEK
jgi:NAD+ diphosphatase